MQIFIPNYEYVYPVGSLSYHISNLLMPLFLYINFTHHIKLVSSSVLPLIEFGFYELNI